jgi:GEVED domain/Subtilase family/SprB repeat/Secretion system C-terminal sorting domain
MKLFATTLILCAIVSGPAYSQGNVSTSEKQTFVEGKNYIEGDMLIQMAENASIKGLIAKAPKDYEVKVNRLLSRPMRAWLINFNHENVANHNFLNWLYEQDEVTLAQNNHKIQMRSTLPTDGAAFGDQWHHNNTGQSGGTVDADIDSDLAWDITTGGQTANNDDIVVCLIESGNLDHNDIVDNKWINVAEDTGTPGVDDDGNGYIDDISGWNPVAGNGNYGTGNHGTNCLGMIGAKGNNGYLVAGANWDVKLMVVGGYNISTDANAVEAYTYPLEMRQLWNNSGGTEGAFVVATSSSWGIDGESPSGHALWCNMYDTLGYHGILNVGATTNQNLNVDVVGDMPTACASDYMIGVGRTDHNDATAGGYGQVEIELGAPGINVITTANTNTTTSTTGTSFACPLTAGVIGLAYSIPCTDFMAVVNSDPKAGADMVLQALLDGVDVIPAFATKFNTSGRLNSFNTLNELMAVGCSGTICIGPNGISSSNIGDNTADINFTANGSASSTYMSWREVGTSTWIIESPATSPVNLTGLTECTEYEYYFNSICGGTDTSSNTTVQTFTTTGCPQCIEGGYCDNSATDAIDEWIEEFTIGTYTNNSGNDNGYGNFTATSNISLDKGVAYNITTVPDWSTNLYDEQTKIWIDLDQNGVFDDPADLVYDQGTATQTNATGTVTVPLTALDGSTRMRVQMAYIGPGQTTFPGICNDYTWGETEDYCVEIQESNPCNLTINETVVDATCNNGTDGSIDLGTVTGGTAPYTYLWTPNGETTTSVTGGAGSYSVDITDDLGCTSTFGFSIGAPAAITATMNVTDVSCNGDTDGAINMTPSGGTAPYTFDWGGLGTTEDLTGLAPNNYTCVITDDNGCSDNVNATVGEPAVLSGSATSTPILTGSDGTIDLTVTGGTPPYSYDWDSGFSSNEDLNGLSAAGSYTCDITDANGCTTQVTVTLDSNVGIESSILSQLNIYPNPSHGTVNIAFKTDIDAKITVYSSIGQVLLQADNLGENIMTLDLNSFATGVYIIQINTADGAQRNERITIKK